MKFRLLVMLFSFCVISCCPKQQLVEGHRVIIGLGDTLPAMGQDENILTIRYDALYTREHHFHALGNNPDIVMVSWMRFWPNGRVMLGWKQVGDTSPATKEDGDDFSRSNVGRYSLVDGQLQIESGGTSGHGCWELYTTFGYVNAHGDITITGGQWNRGRQNQSAIENAKPENDIRIIVGEMVRKPFW